MGTGEERPVVATLRHPKQFLRREEGALTAFGLFLTITMICVGGLGLDVANAVMVRTHLQVAADAAAHAALYSRQYKSEEEAKTIAIGIAQASLPAEKFGDTLRAEDIQFGTWDATNQVFTFSPGSDDAVLVNTQRLEARTNSVGTYFLRFVGLYNYDVVSQSVFETYIPLCLREGFVADGIVDVTTSNLYKAGFCIHSNTHVALNNDNVFEDGVIVTMPDKSEVVLPSGGFESNTGLAAALRSGAYQLNVAERVKEIIAGVQDPNSPHYRSYITSSIPVVLDRRLKLDEQWQEGRIHTLECNAPNQKVMASSGMTFRRGVLVTSCVLQFPEGVSFEDAVIASESTDAESITAAQYFTIGKDDDCSEGGSVQIVTLGGVKFAASVSIYGSQVIAAGDINFTSDAYGIEGVSLIAGGDIQGTTASIMSFCGGSGMENNFYRWYFRLAT